MRWIAGWTKGIMLVGGALTCTMLYAALAPQKALLSTFGQTLDGPLADVVVRNWGALIFLVGSSLIVGAYHPPSRPLALTVAALSKIVYIGLVLAHGDLFLGGPSKISLGVDALMVVLFVCCLVAGRSERYA
jgi:hypothetical protein